MSDEEIKKAFEAYRKRVGRAQVISDLTGENLSPRFAEIAAKGEWAPRKIQNRTKDALLKILGLSKAS